MNDELFISASDLKCKEDCFNKEIGSIKSDLSLEEIRKKIESGKFKLEFIKQITWKDFESFCSYVLKSNGFECIKNLRFRSKNKKRHEIDIIARSKLRKIILSIDAKHWKIGGRSKIALAAQNQLIRTKNLIKKPEKIFSHKIDLSKFREYKVIPSIITLNTETLMVFKGIPIIPLEKLNNFLQNFDGYLEYFYYL